MNSKKLIILAIIFVVILGGFLISKLLEPGTPGIEIENPFVYLFGEDFLKSDVAWFEVWREGKENEKIIIKRQKYLPMVFKARMGWLLRR